MNALMYVLGKIKTHIPMELLHYGLTYGEDNRLYQLSSMDEKIMSKVIRPIVMLDANIVGGTEHIIQMHTVRPTMSETMYTVYAIPTELTMGKEILSAQAITYLPTLGYSGLPNAFGGVGTVNSFHQPIMASGQALNSVSNKIASAATGYSLLYNTVVELVSRNTVAVYASYQTLNNFALLAVLENDSNLNNIQPKSYQQLSDLAILAVKMYIYNKLIIPINSGYLSGGQELGVFKSVLESYSEAAEQYKIFLRTIWTPVAYMNDAKWHHDFISMMIAPDL